MTNSTIPNVPREMLEELRDAANESMNATTRQHQIDHFAGLIAKVDALLSAPSPTDHSEDVRTMLANAHRLLAWMGWMDGQKQDPSICTCAHQRQGTGGVFFQSIGLLYCNECRGWQVIRKPVM